MSEETEAPEKRVLRIGPDEVTVTESEVTILAKHEMPEWEVVRTLRSPSIYFEDKRYLLIEKAVAARPYAYRYVLKPWPAGKEFTPNQFYDYSAEAVAERDSSHRSEIAGNLAWALLLPLYPFLGWLWSSFQERLVRLGYIPRSLTGVSIFITFGLFFAQLVMVAVLMNGSARSGHMMIGGAVVAMTGHNFVTLGAGKIPLGAVDGGLLFALIADAAMRYTYYLRDENWTGGFLEWLFRPPGRKK